MLLLAGCAATPQRASTLSNTELCVRYGDSLRANDSSGAQIYRSEIDNRNLMLPTDNTESIRRKQISIGMSRCAMHASWGFSSRDNRSVTSRGVRVQHVYMSPYSRYRASAYVYTENGRVTGWQD
jgi:hypothetical protein